jgi:hypothetical protein
MATVPSVVNQTTKAGFAPDLKILQPEQQTVVGPLKASPAESARKSAPAKLSEYHTPPQTPEGAGALEPRSSIAVLAVLHISTIAAPLLQSCRFARAGASHTLYVVMKVSTHEAAGLFVESRSGGCGSGLLL